MKDKGYEVHFYADGVFKNFLSTNPEALLPLVKTLALRSKEELEISNIFLDYDVKGIKCDDMRGKLRIQFSNIFQTTYETSDPEVVCMCLEVTGKYISWIDIDLIANDKYM